MKKVLNKLYTIYFKIRGSSIGTGSILWCNTDLLRFSGFFVGKDSTLYKNITIYNGKKGTFKMGDNSHIAPFGYFLIENNIVEIGNDVAIGPFCSFFCVTNSIKGKSDLFRENYINGDIYVGNNVFIGAQCVILPGTKINDNTVIAANSVIGGVLESGFVYGGTPVKKIKQIES